MAENNASPFDVLEQSQAEEALRISENKYRTLFNSIDEGYCIIEVLFDEGNKPVDYRFLTLNPAFERQTGITDAVGKRMREIAPHHEEFWFETYGHIALTGETIRFEHLANALHRYYDVYAFRFGSAKDRQVGILFNDVTERKLVEETLRTSEVQKVFLLKLGDTIRSLTKADEITAITAEALGRYLGVARCLYGEVVGENFCVDRDWTDGTLKSMAGCIRFEDFGDVIKIHQAGQSLVVCDTIEDIRTTGNQESFETIGTIRSVIGVPLIKNGQFIAAFGVHHTSPRQWRESEIELVKEVAERTWAAIERAKAEKALKEAGETYRIQLETEVLKQTKELKESKELLQTAFDTTLTGLAVCKAVRDEYNNIFDFEFQFLNKEAIRYYGGDLTGKRYVELHPGIKQTAVFDYFVKTVEQNQPQDFEVHYQVEGYNDWFRIVTVKLDDGMLMSYENISQRKRAEEELRDSNMNLRYANENLQQFASIASHDLQEPLRKIKMFASVLNQRFATYVPEEGKEVIKKIKVASDRMGQLIREVHHYSKIAYGIKDFIATDLDNILHNVLGDLDLLIQETHSVIRYQEKLPVIEAMPLQIHQLFYNLLTNAIKFRKESRRPEICISSKLIVGEEGKQYSEAEMNRGHLEIVFSDNGIGFDQQFAEQIFQIFERLHSVEEFEGTGVGLALCKKIIENHNGQIHALSIEGEGATFHINLPLKQ